MIGIYKITSPSKKVYIGQSINIEYRIESYKKLIRCKNQPKLYNSLKKYGVEKHVFEVLCECEMEELNDKERYYQDLYSAIGESGLNCLLTKSTDRSGKMSIESRLKMSEKLIGNTKALGLKRSDKQRKLISDRMKGNIPWNLGIKRTEKELEKMSLNRKGKMTGVDNYMSKIILNIETGIFYFGIKETSNSFDGNYHTMRDRLNGKTKNKTSFLNV